MNFGLVCAHCNPKAFVVVNGKKIEKDYEHISKFVGI